MATQNDFFQNHSDIFPLYKFSTPLPVLKETTDKKDEKAQKVYILKHLSNSVFDNDTHMLLFNDTGAPLFNSVVNNIKQPLSLFLCTYNNF